MVTAIIAAGGQGRRMGQGVNKAFLLLNGRPVLAHTVLAIAACCEISEIIVVAAAEEMSQVATMLTGLDCEVLRAPWKVVAGGSERQYSIANALKAVAATAEIVLVHDGARPLVQATVVQKVIQAARAHRAAIAAVPVKDTIKQANVNDFVVATPKRNELWSIQTPQVFDAALLREAHQQALDDEFLGTDEASLVERMGIPVKIVSGDYRNIKITTPEDLVTAAALLMTEDERQGEAKGVIATMRCGMGYDVHRLVTGRKLILGGVEIPHTHGLDGHSDADVLLHAIKDALLGAAALGDIGRHFPDQDGQYRGISSLLLLAKVRDLVMAAGYRINNLDATVVAQKPKVAPYISQMVENIAITLQIETSRVNVKATTTEELGFAGRREGIAAYATASIAPV